MEEDIHEYEGEDITVSYDSNRCIHAKECVEGLPAVFDTSRRPWVDPAGAGADDVAAVVERCPTGALHYERLDDGPAESVPSRNTVTVVEDGPLYLHGDVEIRTADDDSLLSDTRIGVCRCGHSENKPLCDNSHDRVFTADGVDPGDAVVDASDLDEDAPDHDGTLTVTVTRNGPLSLDGPFVLRTAGAEPEERTSGTLCRCGHSENKPFCDGTHQQVGFTTEPDE